MRVWVLGSGSGGNAVVIECGESRVMIDAGFGTRTLAGRLKVAGIPPKSIEACVMTHDHSDHVHGAKAAAKKWGWKLFASPGTARCRPLKDAEVTTFTAGDTIRLTTMDVTTARVPHDANDPVGMVVTSHETGARAGICYDIGHASAGVRSLCEQVDLLVLESNHDEHMLRVGRYPPWLKQRIGSLTGHLANRAAGELMRELVTPALAHLVLAHLSEENNTPKLALSGMKAALTGTAFRGTLTAAKQDAVVGPFGVGGGRSFAPVQFSLF